MTNASSPSREAHPQQSSPQQSQMQHMNAGYNPKFMSPMYNPVQNPSQHNPDGAYDPTHQYSQQLTGTHTNNQMDMSPKRVGN
eukprot:scaffold111563_cov34-Attheya_sp.AAC.2